MDISFNNITFIIVTCKSESIINGCIETLPKESPKIIIENSNNKILKQELEDKWSNIEVILSENNGMGASSNIGLNKCKTQFGYVINPDVRFKDDTLKKIIESSLLIEDFTILTPLNSDEKIPNYKIFKDSNFINSLLYIRKHNGNKSINENIISIDRIDGFSMLINLDKFKDKNFFDEKIFLFQESTDLCVRVVDKKEKMYLIKNSLIDHYRAGSHNKSIEDEMHYMRAWHWMWSKYYFNKKHQGFFIAFIKNFINLIPIFIKYFYSLILFKKSKRKICAMRISGALNALLGKNSWYRPKIN